MIEILIIGILVLYLFNKEYFFDSKDDYTKLKDSNDKDIKDINSKIDHINKKIKKPNLLFNEVINKCSARNDIKFSIKYEFLVIFTNILTVLFSIIIVFKLLKTPSPFPNKLIKIVFINVFLLFSMIIYIFYKLIYPFLKTNILIDNNNIYDRLEPLFNYQENYNINNVEIIEELKTLKSKEISNTFIINYFINGDKDIDTYDSLSVKDYFRYLFFSKQFKLFTFSATSLSTIFKLYKPYDYLKKYKNTTLWKNILLEHLIWKNTDDDNKTLNMKLKNKFVMKIIYYWPSLFDTYNDPEVNYHISQEYMKILEKYNINTKKI